MSGAVCVKISGLNLPRLINRLVSRNVMVNNVVYKNNRVKFFILEKDLSTLNEVCRIEKKFYTIVYVNGFKKFIKKIPYAFGIFLALIIVSVYLISNCLFVKSISLTCSMNGDYDLSKIEKVLKENNVYVGMKNSNFNAKYIQNLLIGIDDVAGCTIKKTGSNIFIDIAEATKKFEQEKGNIVSKYDAVITKIKTFIGSPKVKVGELVKSGDVLIENNDGAKGEIFGKVYFSASKIYNQNQQKQLFTGKIFRVRNFSIFGKNLTNNQNSHGFSSFLEEKCDFYLWNNCFLPLICEETIYYETEIVNQIIPFENVENDVLSECYDDAIKAVPDDASVLNVTYSVVTEGDFTRVDCFVEVEMLLI